jgi:glycine C-acetyltransferase/8-amino-7-oxononanoate synthase
VDVVVGTLGKSLGSYGAYVTASADIVELLLNAARTFIFSTAPPPPAVGAAIAALTLLDGQPGLVEQLRRNGDVLRSALAEEGLGVRSSRTQIVPVRVGAPGLAVELCERVLAGRVFAQAIRPPTVPEGTSRLRLSVMANHRAGELVAAAHVIGHAARELGICSAPSGIRGISGLPRAA